MRHSRSNTAQRLMCGAAAIAILSCAGMAHAEEQRAFTIQPQSLSTALAEFGAQSGHPVMAPMDLLGSKTTRGFSDSAEPTIALAQLLDGTGLTFTRAGDTFAIVRASDPQSGSAAGAGADAGTVQALIVTAQKREENIQDVPIAMSAFTQEDLTRSQVAGGPDLMTQVPNFTFTKTNFSGYSIQIRGIGTQAISATTDPAVAVAFNNTPFIRNRFFEQEFYDLERVEVLRGPQGTLYGRNATAGVVNILSAKPTYRFEAKASADVANYGSKRLEGMFNIPLVDDKAALRLAGAWTKRDGFVKNILTGQQTDGRDLWSARATLQLEPTTWFKADLIYEHFSENDDRLRSGKQLCHKDVAPTEINGEAIDLTAYPLDSHSAALFSQGCKAASLYSPDSFQTPDGYSLPYYGAAGALGSPIYDQLDPYLHSVQSRNLREIETYLKPDYEASNDVVELQLKFDLSHHLSLTSETGFNKDRIFSFEDYNRFDTTPGVFAPGAAAGRGHPDGVVGDRLDIVDANGVFCDPQVGCSNRLTLGDLSTARSRQFSQEFRLSSSFDGRFNFNLGANFLRYDTEDKYYVFANTLTAFVAVYSNPWIPGVSDNKTACFADGFENRATQPGGVGEGMRGYIWGDPNKYYGVGGCEYVDPNNIHNLNDEGRNYFLSKNPYHLISYSGFGEAYYNITPSLKLTAGMRWTVDQKTAPQIPSWLLASNTWGLPVRKVIHQDWSEPTGRLALDWRPTLDFTDQTLVYASYVRGYKAGGVNPPPPILIVYAASGPATDITRNGVRDDTFKAEFVNAFEVGTKNTLVDGKITLNLDAFYYDYTGYQISEIVDRAAANLNFDAKIWGAEVELEWDPLKNLRLGFKGGYERTRLADGSSAIDLIDRTAGNTAYIVKRPFPTLPSNCIVPIEDAFTTGCQGLTFDSTQPVGPALGSTGIPKDLSGNELPNAPHFTATLTTDYTLPLSQNWLVTLHSDLYYQSEAWTRVFNTPGYDRLKAYNNINVAAIFSNEDAGWQVMAYVKNVLNRDSITGAFLNSDDTGLTTNVFLTEPRLYGIRLTKQWSGGAPMGAWFGEHASDGPYPFRIELDGYYGRFDRGHDLLSSPMAALFKPSFPFPFAPQRALQWGSGGGGKLTYTPSGLDGWNFSADIRYGRAIGNGAAHSQQSLPTFCININTTHICHNPSTGIGYYPNGGQAVGVGGKYNFTDTSTRNEESHVIVDFMVGKEMGLGRRSQSGPSSTLSFGLNRAHFESTSEAVLHGRPDLYWNPLIYIFYPGTFTLDTDIQTHQHRFNDDLTSGRSFSGVGPAVGWDVELPLVGDPKTSGVVKLDAGVGGGVLFGKQKTKFWGRIEGEYQGGLTVPVLVDITPHYDQALDVPTRSKSVIVPNLRADLGLSYALGRLNVSGGYRWERYFNALDAGYTQRKTYDRSFDGPYFKISVGFGG